MRNKQGSYFSGGASLTDNISRIVVTSQRRTLYFISTGSQTEPKQPFRKLIFRNSKAESMTRIWSRDYVGSPPSGTECKPEFSR
jgi:hypothetical protein